MGPRVVEHTRPVVRGRHRGIPDLHDGDANFGPESAFSRALQVARQLPGLEDLPSEAEAMTPEQRRRLVEYEPQKEGPMGNLKKQLDTLTAQNAEKDKVIADLAKKIEALEKGATVEQPVTGRRRTGSTTTETPVETGEPGVAEQ